MVCLKKSFATASEAAKALRDGETLVTESKESGRVILCGLDSAGKVAWSTWASIHNGQIQDIECDHSDEPNTAEMDASQREGSKAFLFLLALVFCIFSYGGSVEYIRTGRLIGTGQLGTPTALVIVAFEGALTGMFVVSFSAGIVVELGRYCNRGVYSLKLRELAPTLYFFGAVLLPAVLCWAKIIAPTTE